MTQAHPDNPYMVEDFYKAFARPQRIYFSELTLSACITFAFTVCFVVVSPNLIHWFLLPLMMCATLLGVDALRWMRGDYDLFDPKGIIGLFGLHFFFVAPMLVVVWDMRVFFARVTLEDYRPWLGLMAFLNFIGLVLYNLVTAWFARKPPKAQWKTWQASGGLGTVLLALFVLMGFFSQVFLMMRGGLGRVSFAEVEQLRGGTGIFRLFVRALPIMLIMFMTFTRAKTGWRRVSFYTAAVVLGFLMVMGFMFSGLMGSRSATVFMLFMMAGIIHYLWRPFKRWEIILAVVFLFGFVHVYKFYKWYGVQGVKEVVSQGLGEASDSTGINMQGTLVGDLSRADIQAYTAYVITAKPYTFKLRYGKTFIGDTLFYFPRWMLPNEYNRRGSSAKVEAATDLVRGSGWYDPYRKYRFLTRVFGWGAYCMVNFGLLGPPIAYLVLGVYVGILRRAIAHWRSQGDIRLMVAPILILFTFMMLMSDFDNIFRYIVQGLALPALIVLVISKRYVVANHAPQHAP